MKFENIEPLKEEILELREANKQFAENMMEAYNESYATDEEMEEKGWEILAEYGIKKDTFSISQLKNVNLDSMDYFSKKAVAIATKTNIIY